MNRVRHISILSSVIFFLIIIFHIGCGGGFSTDANNPPGIEKSIFGRDTVPESE